MPSDFQQLVDMGFPENRIKKALLKTNNRGIQPALDWLDAHSDDKDIDEPMENTNEESEVGDNTANVPASDAVAKSMKCDECGKILRDKNAVQFHAAKTNHTKYSESAEELPALSEEERLIQLQKLQEILKQKRLEKEDQDRKEQLEKERKRREDGRGMKDMKEKFVEKERIREAESQRREKEEEKQYKQMLKDRIARERAEKLGKLTPASPATSQSTTSPPTKSSASAQGDTCRLQFRFSDGKTLQHQFGSKEPLSAVQLYISMNHAEGPYPFLMRTTFPNRTFADADMEKPLSALGLCPSAVIIIQKM